SACGERPSRAAEDVAELSGRDRVELRIGAGSRVAIAAEPSEARVVAETTIDEALVGDLGDELDAQRLPRQVLLRVPPRRPARHARRVGLALGSHEVGPVLPRMVVERMVAGG